MGDIADDDHDHVDGCLCGSNSLHLTAPTSDSDLPPAHGGVEPAVVVAVEPDGCGLDFRTGEVTPDADLPIAVGGVA